jgi:hypothetical protein
MSIRFASSSVHALYTFVRGLVGTQPAPTPEGLFYGSKYDTPESRRLIDRFRAVTAGVNRPVESQALAPSIESVGAAAAVRVSDLAEWHQALLGTVATSDLDTMREVLEHFAPVFDELVWSTSLDAVRSRVQGLQELAEVCRLDSTIREVARFYHSDRNPESEFTVALYPVSITSGATAGQLFATVDDETITLAVPTTEDDNRSHLGVVLHEMCHILYLSQRREVRDDIERAVLHSGILYATQAYLALDEALATAIGNGWFIRGLSGQVPKEPWYAVSDVDAYARAIFPLVTSALEATQSLDPEFIQKAMALYHPTLKHRVLISQNLLSNVVVLIDEEFVHDSDLLSTLLRVMPFLRSVEVLSPISSENLNELRQRLATRLVIAKSGSPALALLREQFRWLRAVVDKDSIAIGRVDSRFPACFLFLLHDLSGFGRTFTETLRTPPFADTSAV